MRKLLVVFALWSGSTSAALIDKGSYITDDVLGIDWLDLSLTAGMTMQDAASSNADWRYASLSEVEQLFDQLFNGFYETGPGYSATKAGFFPQVPEPYQGQLVDSRRFHELFGVNDNEAGTNFTYGLYRSSESEIRLVGVKASTTYVSSVIYGLEFEQDFSDLFNSDANPKMGTLLVRNAVVPLPGALVLFASALASFFLFDRSRLSAHNKCGLFAPFCRWTACFPRRLSHRR